MIESCCTETKNQSLFLVGKRLSSKQTLNNDPLPLSASQMLGLNQTREDEPSLCRLLCMPAWPNVKPIPSPCLRPEAREELGQNSDPFWWSKVTFCVCSIHRSALSTAGDVTYFPQCLSVPAACRMALWPAMCPGLWWAVASFKRNSSDWLGAFLFFLLS